MTAEQARARARAAVAKAKAITERAKAENRGLRESEDRMVKDFLKEAEEANETAKTLDRADGLGGKSVGDEDGNPSDGWKAVARGLAKGKTRVEAKLGELLGKDVLTPPTTNMGIARREGWQPVQEDLRRMFQAFPANDLDQGVLHVEHFELGARTVASGSVSRAPLDETSKAEIDQDLNYETIDVKQYAALMSGLPAQLFDSEPRLEQILRASIGLEIEDAIDLDVYRAIDDHADIAVVSGGTNFQTKLRRAVTDLRKNGVTARVAFISDADAEVMDNLSSQSTDLPREYPWGLTLIASPLLGSGEFVVCDPAGAIMHRASGQFLRDDYSGMATNTVRVRAELNGLFEIVEPKRFIISGANLVT